MICRRFTVLALVLLIAALVSPAWAQYGGGRGGRGGRFRGEYRSPEEIREEEEMNQVLIPGFREDVFTFARLKFDGEMGGRYGGPRSWEDDCPQADLTLTYRLFQVTSLKIRPGLNVVDLTSQDITNLASYPFVYLASAGRLVLDSDQAAALRRYMLNGGFMMADDFWGDEQWHHFHDQLKQIFPDREPVELSLDDRIFHTVYNFKKLPQTPSVGSFNGYGIPYDPGFPYIEKGHDPHYYAIYDNQKRMVMLICHNNHFGDGWEHEGDNVSYFDTFSEPMGYPMFINLLYYTMTH